MNPDGSNAVQLTSDEASEFQPNWFPDSQRIAYLSNRDNRLGVWTVDITTRREELLLDATRVNAPISKRAQGEPIPDLRLSPSAKDAVFAVMTPPYGRRALEVMSMDDVTPRRVTDGSASVSFPTWSPDGKQIAASIKDGTSTLAAVVDVASGRLLTLTAERGRTWPRGWSPDSRKVAVVAYREGQWSMRWIDTQTKREGIIIPPVPPNVYVRYPDWSARGDLIVFERGETGGNIWSIRLNR
jgi:Tol biopolymer transport system component